MSRGAGRSTVGAADPGVLDQRLQAIIGTDPDLRDLYVLRGDPFEGGDRVSTESKIAFLLWFAAIGRVAFPNINCFGPEYLDVLNTRLASGATTLEDYVRKLDALDDGAGAPTGVRGSHLPLLRGAVPSTTSPALARHGVSIVGFPTHTLGLGEDARSLFKVLRSLGLAVDLVDVGNPGLERIMEAEAYEPYLSARPTFPTVIFCMPMFQFVRVRAEWGRQVLAGRRVVGYWPWELTSIDPAWKDAYAGVDEIWASTRFLGEVYRSVSAVPVHHVPMLVDAAGPETAVRSLYGLPEGGFTCLAIADLNSTVKRKNTTGAIDAFRAAFRTGDDDVRLILKTTHMERRPAEWQKIEDHIDGDPRILVIDGALSRAELLGLIATADLFLSLHRAEGFGRPIAEAMALGTPVLGTDWSGSQDLLDDTTGYPVGCRMVPVGPRDYPEAAGEWAEPDVLEAAATLRRLRDDPAGLARKTEAARRHIERCFSLAPVAAVVAQRLAALHSA